MAYSWGFVSCLFVFMGFGQRRLAGPLDRWAPPAEFGTQGAWGVAEHLRVSQLPGAAAAGTALREPLF